LLNNIFRGADLIALVADLSREPVSQVEATLQELAEARIEPLRDNKRATPEDYPKKMLIVGNKNDLQGSSNNWTKLNSQYRGLFPMVSISAKDGSGLEELRKTIYQSLDIIRVYTKTPGSKAELSEPVILDRGSVLEDAAESIHKDFRSKLKYAVVWGSGKYDGQRVSKGHMLQDGDIVEFHL